MCAFFSSTSDYQKKKGPQNRRCHGSYTAPRERAKAAHGKSKRQQIAHLITEICHL
jgi:hypothetical protein